MTLPLLGQMNNLDDATATDLKASVKAKYGQAARRVAENDTAASCCGSSGCCGSTTEAWDPITANLYDEGQTAGIPAEALLASLGCGNPTALAELHEGEFVLDLGSGGGIDVLLSARRVGPNGKAYGLDMTDEMLALANENKRRAGATNVEFLKGEIEHIPLPDAAVDVIISNCVINLSADKRKVLSEAFRVLKPGGRFAVSDVVVRGETPPDVRRNMELWIGCVAGALEEQEFLALLGEIGFVNASLEPTRIYTAQDADAFLAGSGLDPATFARDIDGKVMSAFVRATKPSEGAQPDIGIREARVSDIANVQRLLTELQLPLDGVPESLQHFYVATANDRIVGVAGLELVGGDAALLRSVAVDGQYRSIGIASRLIASVVADAQLAGVTDLYLLTTSAREYFARKGFEVVERSSVPKPLRDTAEFKGACPDSATVMIMRLQDRILVDA